jgi:hypothetical protein
MVGVSKVMVDEEETEDESPVEIFDGGDCIILEFHSGFGWSYRIYIDDEQAQQMVDILQNKLNGRWHG